MTIWLNQKDKMKNISEHPDTETKILNAAKQVFIKKGMLGARMQEIADEAGINKALLHYYFRSKENLYEAVLKNTMHNFLFNIGSALQHMASFEEKIAAFVEGYMQVLFENPYLPAFILYEVNANPGLLIQMFTPAKQALHMFEREIQTEIVAGRIKPIDSKHFMVNLISLCVFPVAAKPVLEHILMDGDSLAFNTFLRQRKDEILRVIIHSLKP